METFPNDLKYIKSKIRRNYIRDHGNGDYRNLTLEEDLALAMFDDKFTSRKENKSGGNSTEYFTHKLMEFLSPKDRYRLKSVYYFDFLLFGYDPDEFDPPPHIKG